MSEMFEIQNRLRIIRKQMDYLAKQELLIHQQMDQIRRDHFAQQYEMTYEEAYDDYIGKVEKCCGYNHEGFEIWVPEIRQKYSGDNLVVLPYLYDQCQPTPRDYEAFEYKHQKKMVIPTQIVQN